MKNHFFIIKKILKKIRINDNEFLSSLNEELANDFSDFILKEFERKPFLIFEEYNTKPFWDFILFYCIKYSYNKQFIFILNKIYKQTNNNISKIDKFDILKNCIKYNNFYLFSYFFKDENFSYIIEMIYDFNEDFYYNFSKKYIHTQKQSMDIMYLLSQSHSKTHNYIFFDLIEKHGFNTYYKNNETFSYLCENNNIEIIEKLVNNNLINSDYNLNDFTFGIIENNHFELFKYLYNKNHININHKFKSVLYQIIMFDRVDFLKYIEKENEANFFEKFSKGIFEYQLIFGSVKCFNYTVNNKYIKLKFLNENNDLNNFIFLKESLEKVTKIQDSLIYYDSKTYIENKINIFKSLLEYLKINPELLINVNYFFYSLKDLKYNPDIFNTENNIEENNIEDSQFCLNFHFILFKIYIDFLIKNKSYFKPDCFSRQINYIIINSLEFNNFELFEYVVDKKINLYLTKVFIEEIYCSIFSFLNKHENLNIEKINLIINYFEVDISFYNNKILKFFLGQETNEKKFSNIIEWLLKDKKVVKKINKDFLCLISKENEVKIKQILKLQDF